MSGCDDIHKKVSRMGVVTTIILSAAFIFLALTAYNVQQTQQTREELITTMGQLRTEIREDVAKIGGQLSSCGIRIKHIEDRVIENREAIVDLDRRFREMEKSRE